ncbi:MAG: hypothetical protein AVDCRST_MAG68-3785, partial [uncultured Gemmatimonadetes bacterium]
GGVARGRAPGTKLSGVFTPYTWMRWRVRNGGGDDGGGRAAEKVGGCGGWGGV